MKKLYTVREVASVLGISVRTVYRLIESGKIRAIRVGKTHRIHDEFETEGSAPRLSELSDESQVAP